MPPRKRKRTRGVVPGRITDALILRQNKPTTAYELAYYSKTQWGWAIKAIERMVENGELERLKHPRHNIPLYRLP